MEIKEIPLSLVTPSPMNPRKTFEEEALQELADNIEKQGLLQPITVRVISDSSKFAVVDGYADFHPEYEIICGERRYRAISRLFNKYDQQDLMDEEGEPYNPFRSVQAIVREMDDKEAFDAMITENLQRQDVDPIEEAFAFGQLIKNGSTAEEVAARFGKSLRFVQDRVKLNNLIPEMMVAVKDGKCPIVAAMIISKLDEEAQRAYHKQNAGGYYGFTKSTAESFVSNLFMTLEMSLWHRSGNEADKDFEGGCGVKCSECPCNTSNRGSLFYEMRKDGAGKCTVRSKFTAKTVAYQRERIARLGGLTVRKGEPLEYGKIVLAVNKEAYESAEVKARKEAITAAAEQMGLEIVDTSELFDSRCWYGANDERAIEMLQKGELYRVVRLHDRTRAIFEEEFWYTKNKRKDTGGSSDGLPLEAQTILSKYNESKLSLQNTLYVKAAETLAKSSTIDEGPLLDDERALMLSAMLVSNTHLGEVVGMTERFDVEKVRDWVAMHPEKWGQIMHGWVLCQINEKHQVLKMAEPILADLGLIHCPEEYAKALQKVRNKFDKDKERAEKRLAELGYDLEGNPLASEAKQLPENDK